MSESDGSSLSPAEKKIFEAIENNDSVVLKALLTEKPQNVNILDENKMTPLQHAAYKGNKEIVQTLLDQGANVNTCEHQHNYTALHFAALSGNIDVCLLLLVAGAKSTVTNTVGRTPSQMAAFVGHHNCVATINNFVSKDEIEFYTCVNDTQTKTILPPFLVESVHKFVMQVNVHPVRIVMNINHFTSLQDYLPQLKNLLELMSEREMKRGLENNEVMSFKFYYLSYIIGEVIQIRQKQSNRKDEEDKPDITAIFAKKLLSPGKDENMEFMDDFLKYCIKEFPYKETTLFRQMVATLSSEEPPSALFVISTVINGQRGFLDNIPRCYTCGEEQPAKKCSKCKAVQYCDRDCQRLHWPWHKKSCARLEQKNTVASKNKKPGSDGIDIKELRQYLEDN
ncbi:ankyrin repeat and MYND domain-containing protein 2 [Sitophilus oryzae]|uniref:Ankyrin repeat and MYND domain-containing protein 2 n=1 Tax=Sitophilus oryzae TaxID=7048 RepID=A0A6J2YB36_SITOR|nr:ankyrin repeat and MYND domain-containing protein 2 [Sitophilus oryzae]